MTGINASITNGGGPQPTNGYGAEEKLGGAGSFDRRRKCASARVQCYSSRRFSLFTRRPSRRRRERRTCGYCSVIQKRLGQNTTFYCRLSTGGGGPSTIDKGNCSLRPCSCSPRPTELRTARRRRNVRGVP